MAQKNNQEKTENPRPEKHVKLPGEYMPEDPKTEEDEKADTVYDEDPFETSPYETPPPGEGP
jgi:hypothetical protein